MLLVLPIVNYVDRVKKIHLIKVEYYQTLFDFLQQATIIFQFLDFSFDLTVFFIEESFLSFFSLEDSHCVNSVQIRSFFWSVFSRIWTGYGDLHP